MIASPAPDSTLPVQPGAPKAPQQAQLLLALVRLAAVQREPSDRLALQEAAGAADASDSPQAQLQTVTHHLQVKSARWHRQADAAHLPALVAAPDGRWGVLRSRNAAGQWVADWFDAAANRWQEQAHDTLRDHAVASLRLTPAYRATQSPVLRLVIDEMLLHKGRLIEGAVGGGLLAFLGVLISLYSMQVYDRVIPSGALQTLLVLTLGVLLAIGIEYAAKRLRARVYEQLVDEVDQRLARSVYLRFLSVRLDQLPPSVGSLAAQLRGYESVRSFLLTLSTQLAVDAPFALVFLLVIAAIAGPLAYVPAGFAVVATALSFWQAGRVRALAQRSQAAAHRKIGLLVESVEGAEIIKSGQGGWRMLGRWLACTDEARDIDLESRQLNEAGQFRAISLQQVSYVLLIAVGAWMASRGDITMGAIIACSILSGRVLNPVTQLSGQIAAWAQVKASLQGLDAIWKLEDDHAGQAQPVHVESLHGAYRFDAVTMSLRGQPALRIEKLNIRAGEKIGVIGPVGAGKTTLLRLLSGMYKPSEGRIWLDDIDLSQLSKPILADHMGYLPQDGRLLGGTLRDNLLLGLADPGDEAILQAARMTGLFDAVIASHPQGLQQDISEGGNGLSGGQRQLVNLTRVFLRRPRIWLLDEPTASLDQTAEQNVLRSLKTTLQPQDTMVLVTHKPDLLQLVDRIIVIARHQVVADGPRAEVLARLRGGAPVVPAQPGGGGVVLHPTTASVVSPGHQRQTEAA